MLSLTRIIQNVLMAERKSVDLYRLSHLQVYEENGGHPCFIDKLKFRQVTVLFTQLFSNLVLVKPSLIQSPLSFSS